MRRTAPTRADSYSERLVAGDPLFKPLVSRFGPFPLKTKRGFEPFHALARSIVYQQLNGRAAETIFSRVQALFPESAMLEPEGIRDADPLVLRGAGLSQNKMLALKDLAAKAIEGVVPARGELLKLRDEEIIERLTAVRGIGRWTVEMLLIFSLGRKDVLPVTDLGVRKGFARLQNVENLPAPSALFEYGERWRPVRSVAAWYLWRLMDEP
jgi:DNA-3-methyladenine glycosylase II